MNEMCNDFTSIDGNNVTQTLFCYSYCLQNQIKTKCLLSKYYRVNSKPIFIYTDCVQTNFRLDFQTIDFRGFPLLFVGF